MKNVAHTKVHYDKDSKIALERYVFKPLFGSSHHWSLEILKQLPADAKVLDIGPGSGFAGQALRSQGLTELYAIEPDQNTAKELSSTYSKIYNQLSELDQDKFDLVIMMDVLEHMAEPEKFFKSILTCLKPKGKVLLSVPNIAHWSVRFSLLLGYFEYQERGPLDKTHLQFFSKRRFEKLLTFQDQVKSLQVSASIEPAELVLPKKLCDNIIFTTLSRVRKKIAELLPGLFAYQFLALLEKNEDN